MTESLQEIERLVDDLAFATWADDKDCEQTKDALLSAITRVVQERDVALAKIANSKVMNCVITTRPEDGRLFNGEDYVVRLIGYRIVPIDPPFHIALSTAEDDTNCR